MICFLEGPSRAANTDRFQSQSHVTVHGDSFLFCFSYTRACICICRPTSCLLVRSIVHVADMPRGMSICPSYALHFNLCSMISCRRLLAVFCSIFGRRKVCMQHAQHCCPTGGAGTNQSHLSLTLCDLWGRNEMLMCDGKGCNVVAHQACYGVTTIPAGDWLCDGCQAGLDPDRSHCLLCPVRGGALREVRLHPPPWGGRAAQRARRTSSSCCPLTSVGFF